MSRAAEHRRPAAAAIVLLVGATVALAGCDLILPPRSEGERLWSQRCSKCHGVAGNGNTPAYMGNYKADLTDNSWEHGGEPGSWAVVIREGVFGDMPANPDLSREQVAALVEHLRKLRGETIGRPSRRAG